MPQQTDYNNFTHPVPNSISTEDDGQWGLILADLFEEEVDETIIKRGDLADRPAAGSSNDINNYPRLYLSVDQTPALLSLDDGSGWRDLNNLDLYAALADNETITGTWTFNNEIDGSSRNAAKTFGNSGVNGSHGDFATAQDALDFAGNNDYQYVVYSPGTYGGISIPEGVIVMGSRSGPRDATFSVSSGTAVSMGPGSSIENAVVSNTGDGSSDHGIIAGTMTQVENVFFGSAGGDGINTNDEGEVLVTHCSAFQSGIAGDTVNITANSSNCIVRHNLDIGSINNAGGGSNSVGDNT